MALEQLAPFMHFACQLSGSGDLVRCKDPVLLHNSQSLQYSQVESREHHTANYVSMKEALRNKKSCCNF
jgi:hypothetical protein